LDFGFWILDFGFRIVDFGFRNSFLASRFSTLGFRPTRLSLAFYLRDFMARQFAPFARLEFADEQRTDAYANQSFDRMSERRAHVTNLALFAFVQNNPQPSFITSRFAKRL
jgi:hypothetical protein